ncbi:MAG TPA: hypothetical protein VJN69_12045 [Candidatus Acidoferrales bacterium]|nr:hypothetical protein [Candidatus Acidoferrales bacterium]
MSLPENSPPTGNLIAQLIDELSTSDARVRERAAAEMFALGFARAQQCVSGWLADPDLADCFIFGEYGKQGRFPRTTVGIAIEPSRFSRMRAANGSPNLANVPPDLDAEEFEINVGDWARVDILTTRNRNADGAIARFLQKHGEGIQQIELNVRNVDRAAQLLRDRFGLAPVYPQAREGADGARVNFFLVSAQVGGKLLIELVEESFAHA